MAPQFAHDLCLLSIAMSRQTAPVAVREQLAAAAEQWPHLLATWLPSVQEWALLSTCHRFELYTVVAEAELVAAAEQLRVMLQTLIGVDAATAADYFVIRSDEVAVNHLCRVAAGLDSAVLGEAQIQGQVMQAYMAAVESDSAGTVLNATFRTAIRTGKRARTETSIGARAVSMSSVALSMVATERGVLTDAHVLVIGAGEMSQLALKALHARQVQKVIVVNRTLDNARAALLAEGWEAQSLEALPTILPQVDVVLAATSAPHYILDCANIVQAQARQNGHGPRPLYLIDLALPRDIDPEVRSLPNVALIDVDDLRENLDQARGVREQAIPQVYAIIDEELARWQQAMRELALRPLVVELRQKAERIRQQEVERTLRFLGEVDASTEQHIHHLSHALVNKLLHVPTVRIKGLAHREAAEQVVDTIRDIFDLAETEYVAGK